MDKQQATTLISSTFENAFDEGQYLRFLRELFNGQMDESDDRRFDLYGQYIPDSFKDSVRRYKRLGTYTDPDGHEIDLLVVILRRDGALERARTMQRNFAAYHLKRREKETAIIAYTTEERGDWRFSMVRREPVVTFSDKGSLIAKDELTPVRRYSFLVGQNERSHTAQQQLFPILVDDKNDPTLNRLEDAFNIETVTKEFFERYKNLFLQLHDEIERLKNQNPRVGAEFDQKGLETANFAKKLLGQIVFLYFLQKKGWLGVRQGDNWGAGSKHFLRQLFDRNGVAYDNFFNDVLEPLFYEALAVERPDNLYARLNVKIPFLNGGLFEPVGSYDWRNIDMLIDNHVFEAIFDTFDLYNFTVREDEPLEKEVAVDPEMLGKVFENLLEVKDRKSKGAFYTPREIVHYMCQESLINYLDTRVNTGTRSLLEPDNPEPTLFEMPPPDGSQPTLTETVHKRTITRDDIATFIRFGELAVQNDTAKESGTVSYTYQMPESIRTHAKKLDDALASIKICDPAIGSGAFPVGMMQEIIKAREVLTTYLGGSDERTTYHFKRHAIQESIYGVDIDPGAIDIAKLRLWLSLVVDEDDYQHIKPLPNLDYKIVCGNSLLSVEKNIWNWPEFERLEQLKIAYFDETDPVRKQKQRAEIDALIANLTGGNTRFDLTIYFSEVFHNGSGFDVVIGNPPYVRGDNLGELKTELKRMAIYKEVYSGTADLYVYFYARAFDILKPDGKFAFITSNKFIKAKYGTGLRKYLAKYADMHEMIDFGELPVFDEAATFPYILIASKRLSSNKTRFTQVQQWNGNEAVHQLVNDTGRILPKTAINADDWKLTDISTSTFLRKLGQAGISLETYAHGKIYVGIKTGFNAAFVIDNTKRDELIKQDPKSAEIIKPYAVGDDVRKWRIHQDKWLIVTQIGIDIKRYPAVFRHLSQWEPELKKRTDKGNYWWELRACAYYDAFDKPKIVYPEMGKEARFAFDTNNRFTNNKTFIIPVDDLYLIGILNSSVVWEFLKNTTSVLGDPSKGGRLEMRLIYMKTIPIPDAPANLREKIANLARQCLDTAKHEPAKLATLEAELNQLVYQAYGLTEDEIALIEGKS